MFTSLDSVPYVEKKKIEARETEYDSFPRSEMDIRNENLEVYSEVFLSLLLTWCL